MHFIIFMKRIQFIEICILEIYYIHSLMIIGILVILVFVVLQINHQHVYMEIFLT
ncbi:hypothetical protein GLOIN_2v1861569 [Rhizophagus irregularis DAOM 181602=DAOM 197198]|uniref:Uncharacterized protein n=1 Tax=Rhizophagus irregularis (strain DAOM 181602 / DAOM 197198 / MUCL 43194) TaxID=747089 RepID=A0A2P4PKE3_RHIID|nr:hypothetical protein GLOIN_2v1861569 [Rhizophagus irregularis DAOM 181602=DAOM 197198]POG65866.1 hypothetical protein GLOIN_2v1861569 [Rhizophagus irregularis DAOM 181602=DAOM 197198]|eukprot:XP_025172732.1 hypothetical protein GLOIN_2v1861569 [Rhizophagus irregularis DAOM 181602=DAOM 197198]